ncbi:glutathione synthetase, partial [Emiliania huxleyi CCMP1516]|uniref:Glutathione synthetase n=2 Tax=Emiliania huxleyi TaxID=2903 RepID=A0A0D3I943_EMIH1
MADILASAGAQEDSSAPPETLLGLPASLVARMQSDTLAWQAVGGILIGAGASLLPAPCSLLPYPWPSELFEQSRALAVPFNALVDRVARDVDWLHAATRSVVKQDAFTGRLLQLSESVHAEGPTQPLQLGIYRSDYMVHQPPGGAPPLLRQVELNTISSSFGSLSGKLSAMHAELLPRWVAPPVTGETASRCRRQITSPHISPHLTASGCPRKIISRHISTHLETASRCQRQMSETSDTASLQDMHASLAAGLIDGRLTSGPPEGPFSDPSRSPPAGSGGRLPPNPCEAEIAAALAEARLGTRRAHAVVLMVVQPAERNVTDQRGIEACLWRSHGVPLVRMTMAE